MGSPLRNHARTLEILDRVGAALSEFDAQKIVQAVTDAGTELSGAKFGSFFLNTMSEDGEAYLLYTLSGAPREAFEKFGVPRNTPLFAPTFSGQGIVRSADITKDPRYGRVGPHHGMPEGHLPVRSYLAVPVVARSGAVRGALFFGHPEPGVFTEPDEHLIRGIAAHAAIAIENARLYERAERRIRQQRELIETFSSLRVDVRMSASALLQGITEHVRKLIGAHQSVTSFTIGDDWSQAVTAFSLSEKYAAYRDYDVKLDGSGIYKLVCERNRPFRMTQAELEAHPAWRAFGREAGNHPPMRGWLAAPLLGPDGESIGLIQLSDRLEGEFTEEDEVTLLQFAQMASGALENVRLYRHAEREIVERKHAEEALRESEQRFKTIADTAPAILWMTGPQGSYSFLSEGWYEYTGQTEEEALGFGRLDAVHPDDREESSRVVFEASVKREPFSLDYRLRRVDGAYRWVIDSGRPRFDAEGAFLGLIGSVIDVHERKRAEEELRESEARFRMVADNMDQLAWTCKELGDVTWYNRRWLDYTGLAFEEMRGWDWSKVHHPNHLARVVERVKRSARTGEPWEDTFPLRGRDGQYRWFLSRALPIHDEQGNILRWFGTNTDVTERLAAEEALREADRRKDEFLATLAHELRNPLAALTHGLELMRSEPEDAASAEDTQAMMRRQLGQLVRLVDDLLDVSRIRRGKLELERAPVDLAQVVQLAVETAGRAVEREGHELRIGLPHDPIYVDADAARLAQVFANLLQNAAKFTQPGGHIRLRVERRGDQATVSVCDDGRGIDPDLLPRVFDLFAQGDPLTDRSRAGLGIGLTLVKQLVESHGGSVEAGSDGPGRGSEFAVHLPVCASPIADAGGGTPAASSIDKIKRVLVVDDQQDNADSLAMLLERMGHDPRVCYGALQALDLVAAFEPEIVLLDIGLPDLDGYEVARRIREQPRGADVVLVALTGHAQEEDRARAKEAGFDRYWVKPVDRQVLIDLLGEPQRTGAFP